MRKLHQYLIAAAAMLLSFSLHAQNKPAFSVPFTMIDNRPFIEVKINHQTLHFILDCGADYGLELSAARALHQKLTNPQMMGDGAGAGKSQVWTSRVDTAQIGPVKVLNTDFIVVDMSEIKNKLHLPYLDGIIGYQFMKNYAVQFDYPAGRINFYKTYSGKSPIPFTFYGGSIPMFKAEIDGIKALVITDTGDRTAFTLLNHFAIKTGMIKRYLLSDTTVTGYGLGGPIYARTFTLKRLRVGKLLLADIPSRIPMLKTGAFADTSIDGSIGGGVLKHYRFTIDYKKKLIYFE